MTELRMFAVKLYSGEIITVEGHEVRFSGGLLLVQRDKKDIAVFLPGQWAWASDSTQPRFLPNGTREGER